MLKRIAINGSDEIRRAHLSKSLSAMTGMDYIACIPYTDIADKLGLNIKISYCIWHELFEYSLVAFTKKIMIEQKHEDRYISNGGVFHEISWIKCNFTQIDLIHERPLFTRMEKIFVDYASKEYDFIFHIASKKPSDDADQYLRRLYDYYHLKRYIIDDSNDDKALRRMQSILKE